MNFNQLGRNLENLILARRISNHQGDEKEIISFDFELP